MLTLKLRTGIFQYDFHWLISILQTHSFVVIFQEGLFTFCIILYTENTTNIRTKWHTERTKGCQNSHSGSLVPNTTTLLVCPLSNTRFKVCFNFAQCVTKLDQLLKQTRWKFYVCKLFQMYFFIFSSLSLISSLHFLSVSQTSSRRCGCILDSLPTSIYLSLYFRSLIK